MYEFAKTWNPLAGECEHQCSYCSTERFRSRFPVLKNKYSGDYRLDKNAMKKNLGVGNYWFVCGQNDLFAEGISDDVIKSIIDKCKKYPNNKYLFQSKNPKRMLDFVYYIDFKATFATTIETNRNSYLKKYSGGDILVSRIDSIKCLSTLYDTMITIEPIMDFDVFPFTELLKEANLKQINIGADSGHNNLPEPSKDKILELIENLEQFTIVHQKSNLQRLLR